MAYTLSQLEQALVNAHNAGDQDSARKLAAVVKRERDRVATQDPISRMMDELNATEYGEAPLEETIMREPDPTLSQKAKGVAETGATMFTGMTTGLIGQIEGSVEGILREIASGEFGSYEAADRIEELAMKRAQQLTNLPESEIGQEYVQNVGETLAPLAAIPPLAETQILASASRPALQQGRQALTQQVERIRPQVQQAARTIADQVKAKLPQGKVVEDKSIGAAQVPMSTQRQMMAEEMGFTKDKALTEGQKTRAFEQQRFERETAKIPDTGIPIRERFENQNAHLQQKMDEFIDATGSEITEPRGVGELVDQALRKRAANDKAKIRTLYKEAEKAGEMEERVDFSALIKTLNDLESVESTAPIIQSVKSELVRLGGAVKDANGKLISKSGNNKTQEFKYLTSTDIDDLKSTSREEFYKFIKQVEDILDETDDAEIAWDMIDELQLENRISLPESFTIETLTNTKTGEFSGLRFSPDTANKINEWFSETRKTALKNELGKVNDEIRRDLAKSNNQFPGTQRFEPKSYGDLSNQLSETGKPIVGKQGSMTLNNAEQLRKFVNKATGNDPTNIKFASDIKRVIDEATEGLGGNKYKQARAARRKYAQDYENVGLVKNLLGTKRGSEDRAIALEDVVRKSILDPSTSLDTTRQLRRLLQTKTGDGKQAWNELQGATLRYIQDEMTKGVTTNQRGDKVVSASALNRAISNLDKNGKLDFVFGKKGAEQLRTINEIAQIILTAPPGAVNTSNTATVLAGLMDVAITGSTGVPAPIATTVRLLTSQIKDAKLKARINRALGE
jgi:hypothetical protein